jgi:hypothetical protein
MINNGETMTLLEVDLEQVKSTVCGLHVVS